MGRLLLIRDQESVFDSSWIWVLWVFFGEPEVERWCNPKKRWERTFNGCQIGLGYGDEKLKFGLEGYFLWVG